MKGSLSLEFLLSFAILLMFAAMLAMPLSEGFKPREKQSIELVVVSSTSCYRYFSTDLGKEYLCIEGSCEGGLLLKQEGSCGKSSLLG